MHKTYLMTRRNISLIAIVIAILLTGFLLFTYLTFRKNYSTGPFPMDWSISIPEDDTSFGGIFLDPDINDSLPYYEYRRIADSVKRIKDDIELDNKSIGAGKTFGIAGLFELRDEQSSWWDIGADTIEVLKSMKDSIELISKKFINQINKDSINQYKEQIGNINWRYNVKSNQLLQKKSRNANKLYYFALNGYDLDYNTKFFIEKGQFNLAYVKWDSVIKRRHDSTKTGHYERRQIRVRYSAIDKRVLIPVSKKLYHTLFIALDVLQYMGIFILAYFFIGLPLQILINISKGDAFNHKNISRLKKMAYVLFAFSLLRILGPYIMYFFFRNWIPSDFKLQPFIFLVMKNLYLILGSITIFIIGKAFEKGHRLQKEADLTI